ncbi:MAG: tetratricopeptide repeat protein [Parvibaculum sp.]|uniref:tetratricopeptide repeat-containing glycosyltransferase family protein n=1 Tax=Parvibaculum sp. TaxID=2024848 RepID=UPI0025CC09D4|nr:tetratricopeptide repeat protein [Parvibaculum sp.]MCE9648445.1 tetratricopeptide repeat protein [Parvibaculum sp.]
MAGRAVKTSEGPPAIERLMSMDGALRLARTHLERGNLGEAENVAQQIAAHKGGHPDAFHIMAIAAFRGGRLDKAIANAQQAVARAPKTAAFWSNLAEMLRRRGFVERGHSAARRAVTLDPGHVAGWNNLGILEFERGNFAAAADACRRALALDGEAANSWNNLGNALARLERDGEAHEAYGRAIALRPGYSEAMVNDALCWREEAEFERAGARLDQAIVASPRSANAHLSRAMVNFLRGETARARIEYEWRLALPRAAPDGLPGARWQGEAIAGKRIFVFSEQGLGDTIQSLRHLPALAARGAASISLFVPRNLRGLAAHNFPHVEVVSRLPGAGAADYHCASMSLPLLLDGPAGEVVSGEPYLAVEPEKAAVWRDRLQAFQGRKIGLVWAGNGSYQNDHNRSMKAAMLAPLLDAPGCSFFSLQIGPAATQVSALKPRIEDLGPRVPNMSETAAAISALDLVISVDTSLAHLAGALGKPVWTMLPHVPDWRWGMDGAAHPLYRTMRLFRQRSRRDWPGVVAEMRAALEEGAA